MFRTMLAVICVVTATPSFAQATPESIANSILKDVAKGDAKNIVENLLAKAPLVTVGPSEETNLINSLNTFLTSYGKVEGWELIHARNASSRYVAHNYIIFQEKYALNLQLKFYQGKDGWNLTAFNFTDKLDESLEAQFMEDLKQSLESLPAKN